MLWTTVRLVEAVGVSFAMILTIRIQQRSDIDDQEELRTEAIDETRNDSSLVGGAADGVPASPGRIKPQPFSPAGVTNPIILNGHGLPRLSYIIFEDR